MMSGGSSRSPAGAASGARRRNKHGDGAAAAGAGAGGEAAAADGARAGGDAGSEQRALEMRSAALGSAVALVAMLAVVLLLLPPAPAQPAAEPRLAAADVHAATLGASPDRFASGLRPPYYAVVFTSQRHPGGEGGVGYAAAAARMAQLAAAQPGFLGLESARGADGLGITVSYWRRAADVAAWRRQLEHAAVRDGGRRGWYARYEVRVARVERGYGWDAAADGADAAPAAALEAWRQEDAAAAAAAAKDEREQA